jgi:myo-inositol-1(or 4)-monophosphatase
MAAGPAIDRSLSADLDLLRESVRAGGAIARDFFQRGARSWEKAPGDPVSEADIAVDALLRERLCASRPDYGWLSEETEDDVRRIDRSRVWIVDPIDGTRAFLDARPEFTVAAALVENGHSVLGVIYNPMTDEMFDAIAGGGARCNGKRIRVGPRIPLDDARLLASRRTLEHKSSVGPLPRARFEFINSIAYRMVLVAAGRYDATISLAEKSDWDVAGADIIVREAGGLVTSPDGETLVYNSRTPRHPGVVAASPELHREILDRL